MARSCSDSPGFELFAVEVGARRHPRDRAARPPDVAVELWSATVAAAGARNKRGRDRVAACSPNRDHLPALDRLCSRHDALGSSTAAAAAVLAAHQVTPIAAKARVAVELRQRCQRSSISSPVRSRQQLVTSSATRRGYGRHKARWSRALPLAPIATQQRSALACAGRSPCRRSAAGSVRAGSRSTGWLGPRSRACGTA